MTMTELKKELDGQKPIYILYLDDERDLLDTVEIFAQDMGLVPLLTSDPEEAIAWVKRHRGDLAMIISDLKMPVMDGFAFRSTIAAFAPEIPFAILSAHVTTEIALKGIEHKIFAFIPKPANTARLLEIVGQEAMTRIKNMKEDRELRAGFISEAEVLISDSEDLLLSIEQDPSNEEALNRFFGVVHTIKGASSFFEPKTLHKFAHRYEDVLKKLQRKEVPFSESVVKVLFQGFDILKELFQEFSTGEFQPRDFEVLVSMLDLHMSGNQAVAATATVETKTGSTSQMTPAKTAVAHKQNEDVKVGVNLLNEFMQLSGEVTVIRNMLNKCVRSIDRKYSGDRDVAMLGELLDELHKINGNIQTKISEIRKVPLKTVLKPLPRAVRDVSKQLGKQVELELVGEDLRVDTSIAEVLNNSLLHIVKNSLDHGLENTNERIAAHKPENGKIRIRAQIKEERVFIEIEDDGKGLNVDAIKNKLIKNGSHSEAQVEKMSSAELHAMIFSSGFSTAAQVTDVSGRGVGMSMVKDSVDSLRGEIQIETHPGKGTCFRLVLPVPKSVLIASCLSVKIGLMQFGLVQDDILRVLQFSNSQGKEFIRELEGSRSILFEDRLVPLIDISKILGVENKRQSEHDWCIVILQSTQDGRSIALEVDQILDTEDTVIKNIQPALNASSMYKGATFLDDGTLGLILSTTGILNYVGINRVTQERVNQAEVAKALAQQHSALVFTLALNGRYALPLSDVQRIEMISASAVRHSGKTEVVPYYDTLLEIADLGKIFKKPTLIQTATFPVIVVKNGKRLVGFRVSEILDMVSFSEVQIELADHSLAIEGHVTHQDQTVTMLSSEKAFELLAIAAVAAMGQEPESSARQGSDQHKLIA